MIKLKLSIKLLIIISILLLGVVLFLAFSLLPSRKNQQRTRIVITTSPKNAEISIPELNITQRSPVIISDQLVGTKISIGAFTSGYIPTKKIIEVTASPEQQITITLTPLKDSVFFENLDKGLKGGLNPSYVELLKTQPFWDMLPHYENTFLVEYQQSSEEIIITTIVPADGPQKQTLIQNYRKEALDWLTKKGAKLDQLKIIYKP